MATRRLAKELSQVREKFDAECVGDDLMKWQVAIPGPDDSPYFGGTFLIELSFPSDYPFHVPNIKFDTKIFHPNINLKGEICLGSIRDDWGPSYTALILLDRILAILKYPNADDPLVPEVAAIMKQDISIFKNKAEEWTHAHAM